MMVVLLSALSLWHDGNTLIAVMFFVSTFWGGVTAIANWRWTWRYRQALRHLALAQGLLDELNRMNELNRMKRKPND